jgi:hypothetical protein
MFAAALSELNNRKNKSGANHDACAQQISAALLALD